MEAQNQHSKGDEGKAATWMIEMLTEMELNVLSFPFQYTIL